MESKSKTVYILLISLFIIILGLRLWSVFNTENFSSGEAYYNQRIVEHIVQEKSFLSYDELSYGGRNILKPQLFHLILAFLTFGNNILLKIIPELFMALIVFVVYLISKEISQNENAALISSLFAGFVPLFFIDTLNVISEYTLAMPLLLLLVFCLLKLEEKRYLYLFIALSFILPLIHPIAFMFVLTSLFYFFLIGGGAIHPTRLKKEAILTGILIISLIQLIQYKKALLTYSAEIIWQNAPANIIADIFRSLNVIDLIFGVGIVPLIVGAIGVYLGIIRERKKSVYLFSALIFSTLFLLIFRLITLSLGIMLLGVTFAILSSITLAKIIEHLQNIKFKLVAKSVLGAILILFLITSFIPIYTSIKDISDINKDKINDMLWLKEKYPADTVVLSNIAEGNLVTSIANMKTVLDSNFLMAPDSAERIKDSKVIYTTFTESVAMELIKKYNIKVIYLSPETQEIYGVDKLIYSHNSECFQQRGDYFYIVNC